jgi:hypothetical protein
LSIGSSKPLFPKADKCPLSADYHCQEASIISV